MISSIFIANRGEIAVRIIRACQELGITSVIGYSETDKNTMPVQLADKRVCIGPSSSSESYLNMNNIIAAASGHNCSALHPGVGFLSENAEFAQLVVDSGIIFIGPRPESIILLGDKVSAKRAAVAAGVPVVPGTDGTVSSFKEAKIFTDEYKFPVILKAAAGGGGKGMRVVHKEEDLAHNLEMTTAEAEKSFSDGRVYIERFLTKPRHVEIQLIADTFGNTVYLGERDCTVQRNHQKLIEESPSTVIDDDLRQRMGTDAVNLFKSIGYENVGTVEFLVDGNNYYFMEVNARIQVEHPVTELVANVDLIADQILVASGEALSYTQDDIVLKGYAMECRINALAPGTIDHMTIPGGYGVRIDTWVHQGSTISPYYDSLVMKLLVHAKNRSDGIRRMLRALNELELRGKGFQHNKEWFQKILQDKIFCSGKYSTQYLSETNILES